MICAHGISSKCVVNSVTSPVTDKSVTVIGGEGPYKQGAQFRQAEDRLWMVVNTVQPTEMPGQPTGTRHQQVRKHQASAWLCGAARTFGVYRVNMAL